MLTSGCTDFVPKRTELFSGVSQPRDRKDLTLYIKEVDSREVDGECRRLFKEHDIPRSPPMLTAYHGCAVFYPEGHPREKECHIVIPQVMEPDPESLFAGVTPEVQERLREQEIRHCEGWKR